MPSVKLRTLMVLIARAPLAPWAQAGFARRTGLAELG